MIFLAAPFCFPNPIKGLCASKDLHLGCRRFENSISLFYLITLCHIASFYLYANNYENLKILIYLDKIVKIVFNVMKKRC